MHIADGRLWVLQHLERHRAATGVELTERMRRELRCDHAAARDVLDDLVDAGGVVERIEAVEVGERAGRAGPPRLTHLTWYLLPGS